MAYYTGNVAGYDDLFNILINRCVEHGWRWSGGILSKEKAFLKVFVSDVSQTVALNPGSGILVQGGTGQSNTNLINPSSAYARLGRPDILPNFEIVTWPGIFHLHIFDDPDEVFLVLNFNTHYHYWLAFGVSNVTGLPGTGLWLSGVGRLGASKPGWDYGGFSLTATAGDIRLGNLNSTGFLCGTYSDASSPPTIHAGFDNIDWYGYAHSDSVGSFSAWETLAPLIEQSPSKWNQEAVLLPIHGYVGRPESKRSCAVMVRNARYTRVDHYEVNDIVTFGTDRWRVYPFYFKNASERDCGSSKSHSGTFGWAIRI